MVDILRVIGLVLRALQFIFAITIMGISGYLVSGHKGKKYSGAFGFNLFVSIWTVLVLIYLVATTWMMDTTSRVHRWITLGVEFLTWAFWLAGWASFAGNLNGECHGFTPCQRVKGGMGVGITEWILFTATLVFAGIGVWRGIAPVGAKRGFSSRV